MREPASQVKGLSDLVHKFQAMGVDLGSALLPSALAGGLVVANDAKRRAPFLSGTMRRSIHVEPGEVGPESASVLVGTDVVYAKSHELGLTILHPGGTPYIVTEEGARFMRKDGQYPGGVRFTRPHYITFKAKPFLRPALDENRDRVMEAIGKALLKRLRRYER